MPEVMLKRNWPSTFKRTVYAGKKATRLEFHPGIPVECDARQIEQLKNDIGIALLPVERDASNRARIISDDVEVEQEVASENVSKPS